MMDSENELQPVKKVAFTGIDPDLNGAIVTVSGHVHSSGQVVLDGQHRLDLIHPIKREKGDKRIRYDMPELMQLVYGHRDVAYSGGWEVVVHRIVLERAQVRPQQRGNMVAAAGQALWEAALQLHAMEYTLLWPQNWKRWAGLIGTEKSAVNQKAVELNDKWLGGALRCHPETFFQHDGYADAFVMALYEFCHLAGDE